MFDGKTLPPWLPARTTYLAMAAPPSQPRAATPAGAEVRRMARSDLDFYLWLHNDVGKDWLWCYRLLLPRETVAELLAHPKVSVDVLYLDGVPAGFIELDARRAEETEIAYFGLRPGFAGRGLGAWFLRWGVDQAWDAGAQRLMVHTCDWDSPAALPVYRLVGFVPYQETVEPLENRAWYLPQGGH